jgi:hypothetical protein
MSTRCVDKGTTCTPSIPLQFFSIITEHGPKKVEHFVELQKWYTCSTYIEQFSNLELKILDVFITLYLDLKIISLQHVFGSEAPHGAA